MAAMVKEQVSTRPSKAQSMEELVLSRLSTHPLMSRMQLASGPQGRFGMAAYDEALDKLIEAGIVGTCRVLVGRRQSVATMYYLKSEEDCVLGFLQRNGTMVIESVK